MLWASLYMMQIKSKKEERLIQNKPTCLKCLSLSFRIFIVPREFYLYFGGTHLRYLFLHTALEHGIVQVHPKNVSVSNKCFFKSHITCGNSSEEKKQFQRPILHNYILLDRDELLWFYFFFCNQNIWSSNLINESFAVVWLNGALLLDYLTTNKKSLWHIRNKRLPIYIII